jgi:hypothetical protein
LYLTTYLRRFIPGRADLAMEMKNAATLELLKEWKRRKSGWLDKRGRPYRTPRRLIKWEWGEKQRKAF